MPILIGFSGRKQSGKGTLCRFIADNAQEILRPAVHEFPEGFITTDPSVAKVSMAGQLKRLCHELLGLRYQQCYGSDADKNTTTHLRWEHLPHYHDIIEKCFHEAYEEALAAHRAQPWWCRLVERLLGSVQTHAANIAWLKIPVGYMTAREVLQQVGTEIIRRMDPDAHSRACIHEAMNSSASVVLCDDLRFPDEIEAWQKVGGRVIRLTRATDNHDSHVSETKLDGYRGFDAVVDNGGHSVERTCCEILYLLKHWGIARQDCDMSRLVFPLEGIEVREGLDN